MTSTCNSCSRNSGESCRQVVLYSGPQKSSHSNAKDSSPDHYYYEVLGVKRKAKLEEIKLAYRMKARELHPDKNGGSADSIERFQELQKAYSILSDADKRVIYDRFGMVGLTMADNCDDHKHMARFARSKLWMLAVAALSIITCCFCCCCCCFCCSPCRRKRSNDPNERTPSSQTNDCESHSHSESERKPSVIEVPGL